MKTQILIEIILVEKCRIKVSASGKPTEEVNFAVYISGNTMRDMVGRIIEECVGAREESQQTPWGGVGTLSIRQTLDWIVQPGTRFPESLDIRNLSVAAPS